MKEEGFKEGFLDGAKKNSMDIAKKMVEDGFDVSLIQKYINLSKEEIDML